jgi:hypothetical protein
MSSKVKWGLMISFYFLNLVAVFLVIWLINPNPMVNILLSMYLLLLTGIFTYVIISRKRK